MSESPPTDPELVRAAQAGDRDAFAELYRRHAPRLFSLCARMVNATDAEDLLQESFVQAWRRLGTFRGDAGVGTWLYRLTLNRCLDHLRSTTRRGATLPAAEEGEGVRLTARPLDVVADLDLERAIAQLPDGYRAAFLLHDVEGFGHAEIAAMLGIAEGTSKSQVHKARLRLREHLLGIRRPVTANF